jgi:thiamine-phosphate pyrophosphorylase
VILYAITDRRRLDQDAAALVDQARAAAAAGLDFFQIREPDLPDIALFDLAVRIRDAVAGSALRVLINDRVDIAIATGLDGVHLRATSFAASRARTIAPAAVSSTAVPSPTASMTASTTASTTGSSATGSTTTRASAAAPSAESGRPFLIGRSVHGVDEARAAEAAGGLDYLILGTMFATRSKPADHALAGVEMLGVLARASRLPVLAIGGITLENADLVAAAGAAGLAAIGLFQETARLPRIVAELRRIFAATPSA